MLFYDELVVRYDSGGVNSELGRRFFRNFPELKLCQETKATLGLLKNKVRMCVDVYLRL